MVKKRLPKTTKEVEENSKSPLSNYRQYQRLLLDYIFEDVDDKNQQLERINDLQAYNDRFMTYLQTGYLKNQLRLNLEPITKYRLNRAKRYKPKILPITKPMRYDVSVDYSKDVQEIFQYWQDLGIIKHRESNTKIEALKLLNKTLRHYKKSEIIKSMDNYKKLLDDPYSKLKPHPPFKVGLNRFFKFDSYTNTKTYAGMENIKSWFEECLKKDLSHLRY